MLPGDVELRGASHAMETHLYFKFHASGVALGKAFTFWGLSFLICKMGFLILTLPDCPTLPNDKSLKWNNPGRCVMCYQQGHRRQRSAEGSLEVRADRGT